MRLAVFTLRKNQVTLICIRQRWSHSVSVRSRVCVHANKNLLSSHYCLIGSKEPKSYSLYLIRKNKSIYKLLTNKIYSSQIVRLYKERPQNKEKFFCFF